MRKILSIIVLSVILILLAACNSETDSGSKKVYTEEDTAANIVVSADITDYMFYVIRSDYSDREETEAAVRLRKSLAECTGAEIGITTDWEKNPVYEYEFIVGNTLREDTENVSIERKILGESGFVIKIIGNKIYLAGGDVKGTNMAVDYFMEKFITGNTSGEIIIPKSFDYIQYHQYDIPRFYIGGTMIDASYVIQCMNDRDMRLAESLQESVYYKTGLWLDIVTASGRKNAFILSSVEPQIKGIYQITVEGSSIVFASSADRGLDTCIQSFISLYINDIYGAYSFESDFQYIDLGDYIIVTMPEGAE